MNTGKCLLGRGIPQTGGASVPSGRVGVSFLRCGIMWNLCVHGQWEYLHPVHIPQPCVTGLHVLPGGTPASRVGGRRVGEGKYLSSPTAAAKRLVSSLGLMSVCGSGYKEGKLIPWGLCTLWGNFIEIQMIGKGQ